MIEVFQFPFLRKLLPDLPPDIYGTIHRINPQKANPPQNEGINRQRQIRGCGIAATGDSYPRILPT